jgi:hypothetical protein
MRWLSCLFVLAVAASECWPAEAEKLPSGTTIQVRLSTMSTSSSAAETEVEAEVVAPLLVGGRVLIPQGARVTGAVKSATPPKTDVRATLHIQFSQLTLPDGAKLPISARVYALDNARESVSDEGVILGILASETLTEKVDRGLESLGSRHSGLADFLATIKGAVVQKADTGIVLASGAELALSLVEPLEVQGEYPFSTISQIEPAEDLAALVRAQPFQTTAQKPPSPSDVTNLMYLGTREQIVAAFEAAGWSTAAELGAASGLETVRAVLEQRGYKEAPMSVLMLEGKPPDLTFQKQYNTFAKRHHLRIFRRPDQFQGTEVWVCAATHDIGIEFSPENRTFIHRIDSQIDKERAKVVLDLMHADKVQAVALVDRPEVPVTSKNATGDEIVTDGKMAVLLLR